jgi:ribosomal protein S13
MTDVKSELQEIKGVGEATAEEVMNVLEETQHNDKVAGLLSDALSYYEDGRPDYARKYVQEAYEEVK